jgi:hypothetical protein
VRPDRAVPVAIVRVGSGAAVAARSADAQARIFIKSVIESFGFVAIFLCLATGGRLQQAGGPLAGRDLVISAL